MEVTDREMNDVLSYAYMVEGWLDHNEKLNNVLSELDAAELNGYFTVEEWREAQPASYERMREQYFAAGYAEPFYGDTTESIRTQIVKRLPTVHRSSVSICVTKVLDNGYTFQIHYDPQRSADPVGVQALLDRVTHTITLDLEPSPAIENLIDTCYVEDTYYDYRREL